MLTAAPASDGDDAPRIPDPQETTRSRGQACDPARYPARGYGVRPVILSHHRPVTSGSGPLVHMRRSTTTPRLYHDPQPQSLQSRHDLAVPAPVGSALTPACHATRPSTPFPSSKPPTAGSSPTSTSPLCRLTTRPRPASSRLPRSKSARGWCGGGCATGQRTRLLVRDSRGFSHLSRRLGRRPSGRFDARSPMQGVLV